MITQNKQRKRVLLALSDSHHGFYEGAARYAAEHNWQIDTSLIYSAQIPVGWRGDGILSFIGHRDQLTEFVMVNPAPCVEISLVRSDIDLPRVAADNHEIGKLAAEHFLNRGFRNFLWVPFFDDLPNKERREGMEEALSKTGHAFYELPAANSAIQPGMVQDWPERNRLLGEELRRLPKPLAVFCYNDCVAAEIIHACEDLDIDIPGEVAVLGVDNDEILCNSLDIPLSSVNHDLAGMAYRAAALLDRIMEGEEPGDTMERVPPLGIAKRRSTDILAVNNKSVARALRYLWDNYADFNLSVDDVAAAVGKNRRSLEKAFRSELDRGINEELIRTRLRAIVNQLETTDKSITDIACETGFARPSHLFRTFRKFYNVSPNTYREQARRGPLAQHVEQAAR